MNGCVDFHSMICEFLKKLIADFQDETKIIFHTLKYFHIFLSFLLVIFLYMYKADDNFAIN